MALLSFLFAAAPFALALVRAVQTGHDMRLLWMALASFVGATVVMAVAKAGGRKASLVLNVLQILWVVFLDADSKVRPVEQVEDLRDRIDRGATVQRDPLLDPHVRPVLRRRDEGVARDDRAVRA